MKIFRRKHMEFDESELDRCLQLLDLIGLGVGSTLGLGVYVLAGIISRENSGPAVVLSFLIAAISSTFAGLCYAEFAARVPRAGSAYVYSYVTIGEAMAFFIGWNLIIEYVIGAASVARGLSGYLDSLLNHQIRTNLESAMPIHVSFLSEYPDFFAFGMICVIMCLHIIGVKESVALNNILTSINIYVIWIVTIGGSIKANPDNWFIEKEAIPAEFKESGGEGGFLPFGFNGMMVGAAKCFFAFVGFDCIAACGEEAVNPEVNIPSGIWITLLVVFIGYFSISTVATMVVPYYAQDPDAPLPHIFGVIEWWTLRWVVLIGALFALCSSLLGAMFPLPRVIYSMAGDGLVFRFLSIVNPFTQTPIYACITAGILTGTMALILNLDMLIDLESVGTLFAYSVVAECVLILRFEADRDAPAAPSQGLSLWRIIKLFFNCDRVASATPETHRVAIYNIIALQFAIIGSCATIIFGMEEIGKLNPIPIAFAAFFITSLLLILISLSLQPRSSTIVAFMVPCVPIVPAFSITINMYLILMLDWITWVRYSIWLAVGFLIYAFYGYRNSSESDNYVKPT